MILKLLDWTDVLDRERTICAARQGNDLPAVRAVDMDSVSLDDHTIEHLEPTVPEEELPGAFYIRGLLGPLCGEKTVRSCRQAGIVGVDFTPIPTPLYRGARPVPGGFRLLRQDQLPV